MNEETKAEEVTTNGETRKRPAPVYALLMRGRDNEDWQEVEIPEKVNTAEYAKSHIREKASKNKEWADGKEFKFVRVLGAFSPSVETVQKVMF